MNKDLIYKIKNEEIPNDIARRIVETQPLSKECGDGFAYLLKWLEANPTKNIGDYISEHQTILTDMFRKNDGI